MGSQPRSCRRALTLIVALGASMCIVHCADDTSHDAVPGESRLLDVACRASGCETTGTARVTTGPTSDSVGIRIGPGPGRATIVLPDFASDSYDTYAVQALLRGNGMGVGGIVGATVNCDAGKAGSAGCPDAQRNFLPDSDYAWVTLGERTGIEAGVILSDVTCFIEVQNAGGSIDIADVRYSRRLSEDALQCSTAAVGRSR